MIDEARYEYPKLQYEERVKDWHFFDMKDAKKERPPIQYVIEGLFALPSLNIVYGAPGCLKSLLLADAAMCVVSDHRWLESSLKNADIGFDVQKGLAIWIDFDNGERRTHERFGALGREYDVPDDAPFRYVSIPTPYLEADKRQHIKDLVKHVKSFQEEFDQEITLIVVDNLGTVSGRIDENSSDMDLVMRGLRTLAKDTEAAVVVIHHQRKGSKKSSSRKGDSLRGHSSIEAAIDLALLVERIGENNAVTVVSTKERGPDVDDFGAVFRYEHYEDSEDLYTARFRGRYPELNDKEGIVAEIAINTLSKGPMIQKDLYPKLTAPKNIGKVTVDRTLKKLKKRETITWEQEEIGSTHAIWYSLVSSE